MQLNNALFGHNGRSGYVLKPDFLRGMKTQEKKQTVKIQVFGARHLPKPQRSIISPFIEVQLHEHSQEPKYFSTSITSDNGLNPVWDVFPTYTFSVNNSDLAFLQFIVSIEDMFSDPSFLAQATFPLRAVKTGFRAVSLTNGFSEEIELASLLVHVTIQKDVIKTPGAGL